MDARLNIVIAGRQRIPVAAYGSTERIMWSLGKALTQMGHRVTFLVGKGSACPFASVLPLDETRPIDQQIPRGTDVVHFHFQPKDSITTPYVATVHWNINDFSPFDVNSIFVSRSHAARYGSDSFVYNGLDWDMYGTPSLSDRRYHFHFLGNAAWPLKNVRGAIEVVDQSVTERLRVLGGRRWRFKYGFRFYRSTRVRFHGMVGDSKKVRVLQESKGLIFPVIWPEPFGLAITESLYFGCPVFGTLHGALPELVHPDIGYLSNHARDLADAIRNAGQFNRNNCHVYARDLFNAQRMAKAYVARYEAVISGQKLNAAAPRLVSQQKVRLLEWNTIAS